MLAFAIDRGDQFRKGHAALLSDLFQTVPELVLKANARLVACNDNRALRNQRLHGFRSRLLSRPATSNVSRLPPPNRTRPCPHNVQIASLHGAGRPPRRRGPAHFGTCRPSNLPRFRLGCCDFCHKVTLRVPHYFLDGPAPHAFFGQPPKCEVAHTSLPSPL